MKFHEGRLDDDVAEVLLDADIAFKHRFDDALVMVHPIGDKFQKIVVTAADKVALDDLRNVPDRSLEPREIIAAMAGKRHFGENQQDIATLAELKLGCISGNISAMLHPLHPCKAGAR